MTTKQLLIYESAAPLSGSRRGSMSLEQSLNYSFSTDLNAAPLMAAEFIRAATEYAIVLPWRGHRGEPEWT